MPRAKRASAAVSTSSARAEPYPPKRSPKEKKASDDANQDQNKENDDNPTSKPPTTTTSSSPHPPAIPPDWRDIVLDEKKGEVPCYDKASIVRGRLTKLLQQTFSPPIPPISGSNQQKWTPASMVEKLKAMEARSPHGIVDQTGHRAQLNTRQLDKFLKQSGHMAGGDSPVYYWGYVLLEKLRVAAGEKKTRGRREAEERIPNGHLRLIPKRPISGAGLAGRGLVLVRC